MNKFLQAARQYKQNLGNIKMKEKMGIAKGSK